MPDDENKVKNKVKKTVSFAAQLEHVMEFNSYSILEPLQRIEKELGELCCKSLKTGISEIAANHKDNLENPDALTLKTINELERELVPLSVDFIKQNSKSPVFEKIREAIDLLMTNDTNKNGQLSNLHHLFSSFSAVEDVIAELAQVKTVDELNQKTEMMKQKLAELTRNYLISEGKEAIEKALQERFDEACSKAREEIDHRKKNKFNIKPRTNAENLALIQQTKNDLQKKNFNMLRQEASLIKPADSVHFQYHTYQKRLGEIEKKLAKKDAIKQACLDLFKEKNGDLNGRDLSNVTYESLKAGKPKFDRIFGFFKSSLEKKAEKLLVCEEYEKEKKVIAEFNELYEQEILPSKKVMDFQQQLIADLVKYKDSRGERVKHSQGSKFEPGLITELFRDEFKTRQKFDAADKALNGILNVAPGNSDAIDDIEGVIEELYRANNNIESRDGSIPERSGDLGKLIDKYQNKLKLLSPAPSEPVLATQKRPGVKVGPTSAAFPSPLAKQVTQTPSSQDPDPSKPSCGPGQQASRS